MESSAPRAGDRGSHKVFLGMAAGVGKTYRMLQEGRAAAEDGCDVAIGYLEPHKRPETSAQADGLELISRRRVPYRDQVIEEMDLPAILRRAPELALVDELAHTNAPGTEHEKRYEDVAALLDAGIDVFSTVNVQHLESLNDSVSELTGVRVRETMPDSVLSSADEVVLIDLTPEALIERLRAGKIYPGENVEAALNNFFKIENLQSLREVALRQVAQEVESKRLTHEVIARPGSDRLSDTDAPQAIGEHLLALIKPRPRSQRLVRRAWRSAQRLGAELDLLWISPPGREPSAEQAEQLLALERLSSLLGANLLVVEGDDPVREATRIAEERGVTYVLMGAPGPRRGLNRLRAPMVTRLTQALPGVDVRIVAERISRGEEPQ